MRLTVSERHKATKITAARYQKAAKKKKGAILDEFIELTGYDRCYASYLLKNHGKKVWINNKVIVSWGYTQETQKAESEDLRR